MHEVNQRFGIPSQLDGHRSRFLERVEELIRGPDLDFFISAHPLLARPPLSLGPIELHPIAAEPYLPHPVTGRGSHGGADVVRDLGSTSATARHHHYLTIPRRVRWSWESAATSSR